MSRSVFLFLFPLSLLWALRMPKPNLAGEFSSGFEFYHNSDTSRKRKPSSSYHLSLNSSLSFPLFSIGLGLFYNSEDRFTAQRVHQFNLNPSWRWGRVYLGDFSPSFSEYTLSNISLYGAGIEFFPKRFRFSLVGGRSRRADTIEWSYNRYLYGLKLGGDFLFLTILKAKDDTSLIEMKDTIPLSPQENLVLGFGSNFSLFRYLAFDWEVAGSVHTRDLRSDTIYLKEIPDFLYSFYQPRYSSRVDYALRGGLKFNHKLFTIDFGVSQIGPGFTSFGLSYLKNDSRRFKVGIATKVIPKTEMGLTWEKENDNLVNDKLATTRNQGLGFSLRTTPIKLVNVSLNYNGKATVREGEGLSDSFKINTLTQTLNLTPNFRYSAFGFNQNLSLILTYQDYKNRIPTSPSPSSRILTTGLNYSLTLKIPITFSTSFSRVFNLSPSDSQPKPNYQSYSLTGSPPALLNGRLKSSLTLSYQPSALGRNISFRSGFNYSFTKQEIFNLSGDLSIFSPGKGKKGFSSEKISLSYSRKLF
uniref:Uncharacterized protein n=1 Tax=candidate division WOR-3 bacterium TaxID=2052148 RepID=A0A7C3YTM8_UNCW3